MSLSCNETKALQIPNFTLDNHLKLIKTCRFVLVYPHSFRQIGDNTSANDETSALLKNLSSSASFHHPSISQQLKSASIAASLNVIAAAAAANSQATKLKGKRKSVTGMSTANSNAIDMLNDRLNVGDSKRFCETSNSKSSALNKSNEKRK